jgi:hypothetical protein
MSDQIGKDVLNTVKKRTGKSITEKDIHKLAGHIKPSTVKNETELKKLIQQVSTMAGIPVSETTTKEIITAVKKSGLNVTNLEQLMKTIMKK